MRIDYGLRIGIETGNCFLVSRNIQTNLNGTCAPANFQNMCKELRYRSSFENLEIEVGQHQTLLIAFSSKIRGATVDPGLISTCC